MPAGDLANADDGVAAMKSKKVPSAKQLSILAMQFRGTRDEAKRITIARAYALAVDELVASKKWQQIPPLEDQLPDEWMPEAFFEHWSLTPPPRRAGRTG
jgi:hypothetical protein